MNEPIVNELELPLIRTIEIRIFEGGYLEVIEEGKTTGRLSWDECLGQIAEMTHYKIGAGRYRMKTPDEWAAEAKRRIKRREESQS